MSYFDFAHKIHVLAHKLNIEAENALEKLDLSLTGYKFLHILNKKGPQSQDYLSKMTGISPAATSKRITQLHNNKRITVTTNKKNRRKNTIKISNEGRKVLAKAEIIIEKITKNTIGHAKNLDLVNKELDKLIEPIMRYCK